MKTNILVFCSCLMAAALQAQIIHVPADYPTIQLGINAAIPGDTVLVAEGIYYEQINFLGKKPLIVASEFILEGDTSHITNTVIDGSLLPNPDNASVVYFVSGEDTTSILCGFTIQHGKGTYTPDNLNDRQGGGIWISESGAKIIYNRITHNTLDDTQSVNGNSTAGAGIGSKYEDGSYWIVIGNNTIDSNTCISKYDYAWGGGISTSYNSRIVNNIIINNICSGVLSAYAQGAGIACAQDPLWSTPVLAHIQNNIIKNNQGLSVSSPSFLTVAGAIIFSVQTIFINNEVVENQAITSANCSGVGGVCIYNQEPVTLVSNNIFKSNITNTWAGGLLLSAESGNVSPSSVRIVNNFFLDNEGRTGGAFMTLNNPVILENNVFSGNNAEEGGATYFARSLNLPVVHLATLVNNSFSGNTAKNQGGAIYSLDAMPLLINSVFWGDSAASGQEIFLASASDIVEMAYSTLNPDFILGNYIDAGGNLNEDPLFNDSEMLSTEPYSPCVDAGVPAFACNCGETHSAPLSDITGGPRPAGIGFDMGAYDLAYSGVGIRNNRSGLVFTVRPNPCSSSATFTYLAAPSAYVLLRVYNNLGQHMATLVNSAQQTGEQTVKWDTKDLPAGVYYYLIQAGNQAGSGKMVKL